MNLIGKLCWVNEHSEYFAHNSLTPFPKRLSGYGIILHEDTKNNKYLVYWFNLKEKHNTDRNWIHVWIGDEYGYECDEYAYE